MDDLRVSFSVLVPAADLAWEAVRASGPGGQNVNKVASKVVLRFDLAGTTALPEYAKSRMRLLFASRLDEKGCLLVMSQATRDQPRNLEDARQKLAALIRAALVVDKPRRPTAPSRGAKRRRVADKRAHGETKAGRGRVRGDDGG